MKNTLFLFVFLMSFATYAQTNPTIINNHGKGAYGIKTAQLLGVDVMDNWTRSEEPRDYPYQGTTITVKYPQLVKYFNFNYRGEAAQGIFIIEYGRFNAQGFLKFQIYLVWPNNTYSYFIAKAYGNTGVVNFYESDILDDRITLDPNVAFSKGGAKVWVMEVIDFEPNIKKFYDAFLKRLENETKSAIQSAMAN